MNKNRQVKKQLRSLCFRNRDNISQYSLLKCCPKKFEPKPLHWMIRIIKIGTEINLRSFVQF